MSISKEEVRQIADEAAEKGAKRVLEKIGFEVDDHQETQTLVVHLKELVENEGIKALAHSGLNREDFDDLKEILEAHRNAKEVKKSLVKKVLGWFTVGGLALGLGYIWGLFTNGGDGTFPPM